MRRLQPRVNYLSIDVEDYFQVSAFETVSPPSSWDSRPLRVEHNVDKILELLSTRQIKATFFILGWVAERCPQLVKKIAAGSHEIASHGYLHQRVSTLSRQGFRDDIRSSKSLLEDLSGQPVQGYRAPSYSISPNTLWAFDELYEAGYHYDSSVFPIAHDLYGIRNWPRFVNFAVRTVDGTWQAAEQKPAKGRPALVEVPITTLRLAGRNMPVAGGGYFRLFPYCITRWALRRINRWDRQPFVFYLHPWELDPAQPRLHGAGAKSHIRHYLNLKKTEHRFKKLLRDFNFDTIIGGLMAGRQEQFMVAPGHSAMHCRGDAGQSGVGGHPCPVDQV